MEVHAKTKYQEPVLGMEVEVHTEGEALKGDEGEHETLIILSEQQMSELEASEDKTIILTVSGAEIGSETTVLTTSSI